MTIFDKGMIFNSIEDAGVFFAENQNNCPVNSFSLCS